MRAIALLYFLICTLHLYPQDIHFSNWTESPLISSAPTTGYFSGNYRILSNFRNQWRAVTTPYKTLAVSAEARDFIPSLPKVRAALAFARDITGDSQWITTQAQCILAYEIKLNPNLSLTPLLGTGITQQRYSDEHLQYDRQWNGTFYDPSLGSGENFTQFNNHFLQVTHGISLGIERGTSHSLLGYSMQINSTNDNAVGFGIQRYSRTTLVGIHQRNLGNDYSIEPSIQMQFQKNHHSLLPGIKLYKALQTDSWHRAIAHAGMRVRIHDALIPLIGIQYDQWLGGISYDINLSKLKTASNGRGSFELYIGTILKNLPSIQPTPYCRPLY